MFTRFYRDELNFNLLPFRNDSTAKLLKKPVLWVKFRQQKPAFQFDNKRERKLIEMHSGDEVFCAFGLFVPLEINIPFSVVIGMLVIYVAE